MKKAPAFQFYARDFLVDTMLWTAEQVGAYWLLLSHAWVGHNGLPQCELPNDECVLAKLCRVSPRKWAAIRGPIMACFHVMPSGNLAQGRMLQVLEEQEASRAKRVAAAGARWSKGEDAMHKQCTSNADAKQCSASASASASATEKRKISSPNGDSSAAADGAASGLGLRAEFKEDFDLWGGTLPDGVRRVPTEDRFKKYKARRQDSTREEIRQALQGWKYDPWEGRREQNDLAFLLRNRAAVEKFSELYRKNTESPKRLVPKDGDQHRVTGQIYLEEAKDFVEPEQWAEARGVRH